MIFNKFIISLSLIFASFSSIYATEEKKDENKTDKIFEKFKQVSERYHQISKNGKEAIEEMNEISKEINELSVADKMTLSNKIKEDKTMNSSYAQYSADNLYSENRSLNTLENHTENKSFFNNKFFTYSKNTIAFILFSIALKYSYDLYKLYQNKPNSKYKICTLYYLQSRNKLIQKIVFYSAISLIIFKCKNIFDFIAHLKNDPTIYYQLNNYLTAIAPAITVLMTKYEINKAMKGEQFKFLPTTTKYKFSDVAGEQVAKKELEMIVDFIKNPLKYERVGTKLPRGILLVGQPGTGKTLLAKAVAGEASCKFFSVAASEFSKSYVGQGRQAIKDLFTAARKNVPSIIFIDEFDALASNRNVQSPAEKNITLNELLVQMDGLDSDQYPIIVIAATNNYDDLDKAAIRSGRFDKTILVQGPQNTFERLYILQANLKDIALEKGTDLTQIARETDYFTGADLANLVNQAAIIAARLNKENVNLEDFKQALKNMKQLKGNLAVSNFRANLNR